MVPQPPPPSSNAQNILQFLSPALSRRGSEELPYSEDVKWLIRQHLLALSGAYPSLQPKTGTFTHNDGRVVHLLHTDGTVPMVYQGVTYNIPIVIWLMETYPRYPPKVFVNPTSDMIIRRQHPFVNPNGNVSVPYLQNWVYPSSNLLDLARELSQLFSSDPPLYSQQRRNPTPNPNPNPSPTTTSSNYGSSTVSGNISVRPAIPPRTYPPSPYGMATGGGVTNAVRFPSPAPPQRVEDAGEGFRRNAINKLVENLHNDIEGLRKTRETEMDGLFTAQAALRQREEQLSLGLREMHDEKEGLEQQLQMILMNTDVLEGWVRENEGKKVTDARNMNVDDAFEPSDALSKQMLDCTSTDLSIEDVVYSLDKAVQEGSIPFDQYLRNVRFLSREQFFHRATAAKVRAVQMQAHVTSMASRASPYGG